MSKILVAYATNSGTTAEVAQAVAEEIRKSGCQVDLLPIAEAGELGSYSAVVLGAPMIMGWHPAALQFLRRHKAVLAKMPLAVFTTCLNLTRTDAASLDGVPVFVDEKLALAPRKPGRLTFKEGYAQVKNYLRPILKAAAPARPVSAAFFGGRLDIYRLKWYQALFVMLVIQARPGEHRNWEAIRGWAAGLPPFILMTKPA
ncbi:MAG TPA: flavodoxin domain-containing protein [Anaerolineales bacterium]|nr:flavodoxin domain-containing protein [Anaerolineales bacterium]